MHADRQYFCPTVAGGNTDMSWVFRMQKFYPGQFVRRLLASVILVVTMFGSSAIAPVHAASPACPQPGEWIDPVDGKARNPRELFAELSESSVVLLGESHDRVAHHRWQLHTLAGLYALNPHMVIGFEMFPRSVQPQLDRWVNGEFSDSEFLEASRWEAVWGYDADLYLPLFHFARQNRVPMVALNVERTLVARVADDGWAAVPPEQREGVGDPAPVSDAYRRRLAEVFLLKRADSENRSEVAEQWEDEEIQAVWKEPEFRRFVEAQSTWDRAMAEGLVVGLTRPGAKIAIGVMGRGHVEFGHGVVHQLHDLEMTKVATLLPGELTEDCETPASDIADAVFVLDPQTVESKPRPLLGVTIEAAEHGVRVTRVGDASVAEQAGIRADDMIVSAAGVPIKTPSQLVATIAKVAFGTWLPLTVMRGAETVEIVAKFPATGGDSR